MNTRMKKKALKTKHLTRKERIRNQRRTIHMLFEEKKQLAKIVDIKNDTILQLKYEMSKLGKKKVEVEEMCELQKKDAIAANMAYEDTEGELQRYIQLYNNEKSASDYYKKRYIETSKQLDEERAKPLWKKVLNK